jgi:pyruvate/2-oxoglutarate dehydrogenase complex dihydrolipoamide dehydrogenase (E3) component
MRRDGEEKIEKRRKHIRKTEVERDVVEKLSVVGAGRIGCRAASLTRQVGC